MEAVFLDTNNQKYTAHIIHQENHYFGAYVFDMNEFIVGHPDRNIAKDNNMAIIFCYDYKIHLDKLFDSRGNCDSYVLKYFKNPDPTTSFLKTIRLIISPKMLRE